MKSKLLEFIRIASGKGSCDDLKSFGIELANGIFENLPDMVRLSGANRLVVGCEQAEYEDALKYSKSEIIKKFRNQFPDGTIPGKLEKEGGYVVSIHKAPKDKPVSYIKSLPAEIWFYLEKYEKPRQVLVINRWRLDPDKEGYIVGRGNDGDNDVTGFVKLALPNAGNNISRRQAILKFIDGEWKCEALSSKCDTYVDGKRLTGTFPRIELGENGNISFGNGGGRYYLEYHCENEPDEAAAL